MKTETPRSHIRCDNDFDLRIRAEMALAFEPGDPPATLLRRPRPWMKQRGVQRLAAGLLLTIFGGGTVLAMRPPDLIRETIEHEARERSLRGSSIDTQQLLSHLGLGRAKVLPGFPQLMRVCDIEGHVAYHLTTHFEKGGLVNVFAFDKPVDLKEDSGWWNGVHWRVIRSPEGKPLVLISTNRKAMAIALSNL